MNSEFQIPEASICLYIKRRTADLETLKVAMKSQCSSEFFRIGHGLKGNAVSYGFPELESIGKQLELVSENSDWHLAETLISELNNWCAEKMAQRP